MNGIEINRRLAVKIGWKETTLMECITIDDGDRSYDTYVNGVQVKPKAQDDFTR